MCLMLAAPHAADLCVVLVALGGGMSDIICGLSWRASGPSPSGCASREGTYRTLDPLPRQARMPSIEVKPARPA